MKQLECMSSELYSTRIRALGRGVRAKSGEKMWCYTICSLLAESDTSQPLPDTIPMLWYVAGAESTHLTSLEFEGESLCTKKRFGWP